ncbi:Aste57867_12519 [Aphanomyces stellatus]|uniref:Aste57867_12519 protein n=1 Tax=Aphanomyces stellatus TaxID=120398 RepID=A0A485KWJ9_9STRA|nr:hypothetical protein As57867_012473 [Aphanomyces stellatus]VFT89370.1 Aste57867_12519 [Aphanomyces stellatus]
MQRRWSSIRQDGFRTHCHALFVGPKVVFRVSIETTIATADEDDATWVAAVSKAKLDTFDHDMQLLAQAVAPRSVDGEFEALVNHVAAATRSVLVVADAADDARQASTDMERFVTTLLNAFGLLTSLPADSVDASVLTNDMLRFYVLLRKFLMLPDGVQHARNKLALAVLSLQDVDPPSDTSCCICLDAWEDPTLPTVKLPCEHVFHEDCVMVWMRQSVKCPVCRASIGQLPRSVPAAAMTV